MENIEILVESYLQKCSNEHVERLSVLTNKEANPPTEIYDTMHLYNKRIGQENDESSSKCFQIN